MRERYGYHPVQYDRGQEEYKARSLESNVSICHPVSSIFMVECGNRMLIVPTWLEEHTQ